MKYGDSWYFYWNGSMVHDTMINVDYVNDKGEWVSNESRSLALKS
ncbi:hypothetical protein OD350_19120 [Clostridium beijerinckii]|uniref:Glucan-binding YG repeat protein n=1 Tax=Clostridium beijerinckii TaxID=1520 RepID=A0AAX0B904_CLOBE|nr:hypothetical protein [Clostridium beijerinckii]NRT37123.1 glucan-binding YG repeat protein [Clostridium beijerinckii]NRT43443.1 glucan-binding YG repeat protein [Clostridium beijerinckii]NRT91304.1 glucan-binding YG repeat protein [Clostridium beijerinckii]NRZ22566.1 glucan-binding YG repeat protein [Clostridium beijerinckii]NYC70829.1 glucan-binding YG repeat protein [Clostridium beijerinckii]